MTCFIAAAEAGDDAELVAAETRNQVLAAGGGLDMAGDGLEQFVAGIVAKAVVDTFEVVDVEEHHRQPIGAGRVFGQLFGEQLVEAATVDQVGQRVVVRSLLQ
ncbi:hypothetical protein D3C76_1088930 [compost metagenome]